MFGDRCMHPDTEVVNEYVTKSDHRVTILECTVCGRALKLVDGEMRQNAPTLSYFSLINR